jgi:predicted nucleic acid-binding protein
LKLVVDTNIIISVCLHPASQIGRVFLSGKHQLFSPFATLAELKKHSKKIERYGASKNTIRFIIKQVTFVNTSEIADEMAAKAFRLMKDIDETDTPFLELSYHLNCKIWTGDRKFHEGLFRKGIHRTILTRSLLK